MPASPPCSSPRALELVRSFSSQYFPNTWQGALGIFLLLVILFLPEGLGSLVLRRRRAAAQRAEAGGEQQMTALLETQGLQKSFGAVVAAKDISVAAERGERLGLIGNNGAGKTTFVNIVTGYCVRMPGGRARRRRHHRAGSAPCAPAGSQPLLPDPATFRQPHSRGESADGARHRRREGHVGLAAGALREMMAGLEDLLERFRLEEYRHHTIAALPGGVRKLVDIAMAVTHRPKLLLLDEPSSGVAAEEKFPLMDVIMRALEGSDATVIFVEHDMEIVGRYAERVLAFYEGRVIADGTPTVVLGNAEVQRYVTGVAT